MRGATALICTRCGRAGDNDASFCRGCGARLTAQPENAAGAPPQAPGAAGLTGLPPQAPVAVPRPATAGRTAPSVIGVGVFLTVLGTISLIAAIVLQFAKVTIDGTSVNVSQANGICQSTLGQLGQAFSSGFGDSTPTSLCHKAAMIEDWKGITVWLAIVLILIGVGLMLWGAGPVRRWSDVPSAPGGAPG